MVARSPLTAADITGDIINRFWEKVSKADHPLDCWEWIAAGRGLGYGCLKIAGRVYDSHRLSWLIHFGDIPTGQYVCHKCDNRRCVRPDHLFLGTPQNNFDDMRSKGRERRAVGERCHAAKITADIVTQIRTLALDPSLSYTDIGNLFGIERTTAAQIARGRAWKHVETPIVIRRPATNH